MGSRIAEIVKRANLLEKDDFAKALEFSQRDSIPLALFILRNNMVGEAELMDVLSKGLGGMEVLYPDQLDIEPGVLQCVPRDYAIQFRMIPVNRVANNLVVAVGDPTNIGQFDSVSAKLGVKLKLKLASELSVQKALERHYYGTGDTNARPAPRSSPGAGVPAEGADNYVIGYIDRLMQSAAARKASDIHVEPFEAKLRVRLRIDGDLVEFDPQPRFEFRDQLIARIKILSKMDISEKRLPQDGNAKLEIPGYGKMDFRVSVMPSVWGEKAVLRLLDKSNLQLDMTKLGFDAPQLEQFKDAILQPYGMVIVTGPTGSGKTTTLYSALNELNRLTDNVVTAEDPVEFTIPGITQVNVRPDIDFTFAKALKAFLRQDPDVIMVGEIRDGETAEIAMKAALTGHVVLSTLHTNNASETVERLKNLKVDPFTIISAVNAVVAQRLVRKICENCMVEDEISDDELLSHGLPERYLGQVQVYRGEGCESCNGSGYRGRCAIYEVLVLNEAVKTAISHDCSVLELKRIAMENGMQTLRQSAWKKVAKRITTIEQLLETSAPDGDSRKIPRSA